MRNLDNLVAYVHQVLCDKDSLDPAQTPLLRTPLRKGARECGIASTSKARACCGPVRSGPPMTTA